MTQMVHLTLCCGAPDPMLWCICPYALCYGPYALWFDH